MRVVFTHCYPSVDSQRLAETALAVVLASRWAGDVRIHADPGNAEELKRLGLPARITPRPFQKLVPWSLQKIQTYQEEAMVGPFVHLDGDFFTFAAPPERVLKAAVATQNLEGPSCYGSAARLPEWWRKSHLAGHGYNMGILVANDTGFITSYCTRARGAAVLAPAADPNVIEQGIFARHARDVGLKVEPLIAGYDTKAAENAGFCHLMWGKNQPEIVERVRNR